MNARTPAPRWLRLFAGTSGNVIAYVVAALAIGLSVYVLGQYQTYANCTAKTQDEDQRRTAVLSPFTDAERAADRALLIGPLPGGPDVRTLRDADLAARAATDRARAANPAPGPSHC